MMRGEKRGEKEENTLKIRVEQMIDKKRKSRSDREWLCMQGMRAWKGKGNYVPVNVDVGPNMRPARGDKLNKGDTIMNL